MDYKKIINYVTRKIYNTNNVKDKPLVNKFFEEYLKEKGKQKVFVVMAPTGYGKTVIPYALPLLTNYKTIYVLPTRALIDQNYERGKKVYDGIINKRYRYNPFSPFLISPVTVTTFDSYFLTLGGLCPEETKKVNEYKPHYLISFFSVFQSASIFDEVHLSLDMGKGYVLLKYLNSISKYFNTPSSVFLSATIPTSFLKNLKRVVVIKFSKESYKKGVEIGVCDKDFLEKIKNKEYKIQKHVEPTVDVVRKINFEDKKGLVVVNTVNRAIELYNMLKDKYKDVILVHSRFREVDRKEKVKRIEKIKKGIVVSTQAIEVGIDYSSNVIVTEAAPINSIIQRFGRFLRKKENVGEAHIILNDECYRGVYKRWIVEKSFRVIKERSNLHNPLEYQEMVDAIYDEWYMQNEIDRRYLEPLNRLKENIKNNGLYYYVEKDNNFWKEIIELFNLRDEVLINVFPEKINGEEIDYEREIQSNDIKEFVKKYGVPVRLKTLGGIKKKVKKIYYDEDKGLTIEREGNYIATRINEIKNVVGVIFGDYTYEEGLIF